MKIELIDNISKKLVDVLLTLINSSRECKIAVAFVSAKGFSLIEEALHECIKKNGHMEFLVGLDMLSTDPNALWNLFQLSQSSKNVEFYCFSGAKSSVIYHPKLYITNSGEIYSIVIGSSNLTEGGLKKNFEVNMLIQADQHDEIISDTHAIYNTLKFHPNHIEPDEEFLSIYEKLHSINKKQVDKTKRDKNFKSLKTQFKEKALSLNRPKPTKRDLVGWHKLVYEKLPKGKFGLSEIYKYQNEFKEFYPTNENIRAKIRQVLQDLGKMNLVNHIERGIWMKEKDIRVIGS